MFKYIQHKNVVMKGQDSTFTHLYKIYIYIYIIIYKYGCIWGVYTCHGFRNILKGQHSTFIVHLYIYIY